MRGSSFIKSSFHLLVNKIKKPPQGYNDPLEALRWQFLETLSHGLLQVIYGLLIAELKYRKLY